MIRLALLLSLSVGCLACIDSLEPEVGPLLAETCYNVDSDPSVDVSYGEQIVPLIFEGVGIACLECHAPTAPTPIGFEVGGLDLSSFERMSAGGISGTDVVVPGRPCQSILFQKVQAGPPFGGRMPLDGPPYLSALESQLLHDWIVEGARNN